VFKNNEASSDSGANDITNFIIIAFAYFAPLLGGDVSWFNWKKCPPAWLHDFFKFA
jgi:hypothetical protein